MNNDAIRRLETLAREQGTLFTRAQAYACGIPKRTVENQVASGRWVRVGLDVLAPASVLVDHDDVRLRAATLALRGGTVAHESAGKRHGFSHVGGHRLTVAVPARSTHRFPGVMVRELTDLRPDHVDVVDGLPVTKPARTAVDLAGVLHPHRLERCIDDSLAAGVLILDELVETYAELARRGKPGFAALRKILDTLGPGTCAPMSVLERRFAKLVAESGLPAPIAQFRPPWWDGCQGVVDFAYVDEKIIIELDGRRWHARNATYDDDRRRDNTAQLAGWRVLRFTWHDVVNRPGYVLATLRSALANAA